jgi:cysteine desulfurase/selenocysteine lyase
MTADHLTFAPPPEIAGQLGQVVDPGGGFVPGLPRAPVPGAMGTATPGLAESAIAPVPIPVDGVDDRGLPPGGSAAEGRRGLIDEPSKLARAIERLAGELFGPTASSLVPVPIAPLTALSPSNVQLPASPGIGPGFAAPPPTAPQVSLDEPSKLALAIERFARLFGTAPTASIATVPLVPAGAGSPSAAPGISPVIAPFAPPETNPSSHGAHAAPPARGASSTSPQAAPVAFPGGSPSAFPGGSPSVFPGGSSSVLPSTPATVPAPAGTATTAPGAAAPGGSARSSSHDSTDLTSAALAALSDPFAMPAGSLPTFEDVRVPIFGGESPADLKPAASNGHTTAGSPVKVRDLGGGAFDPYTVRRDFPILEERVHGGKRLVWLDNAATTQKPRAVIDRLTQFYEHENSNIHRAAHVLAARATDAYEAGRESTRRFVNAPSTSEIIFVRGATEGINLIAQSWGRRNVAAGDEIVITHLEHHANIVPWQQLCAASGARLRVAPVDDRGDIILEAYERLLGPRTRLVAFPQVSNALGTVTPAREMVEIAHRHGAVVVVDGAQAVSHMRVDVQALDCDFYVFSGHKVFAPTGIGAVFGKRALLEAMPPWQGGGNMIQDVTFERTTYQQPPFRFEAGTGNIADAVGLGTALDYVMRLGIDNIDRYEHELLHYAEQRLAQVRGLTMIGAPRHKAGVLSFVLDGQRTEDVGSALDKEGIAVRSGHHCAQPILRRFGVEASVRASLAFYNICEDIDALVDALHRLQAGR